MTNIKEVAKRAGVSASTVSRVLTGRIPVSDETRNRVLSAVKELDYHPNPLAQGLKGGSIKTIGLIIPNVRNLVFPAAIRGIEAAANAHGYITVLCNTDEEIGREKFYIENLRRRLVDGFIVSTARPGHEHLLELEAEGFPVVFLLRQFEGRGHAVLIDNFGGARTATQYLISRGLQRIAILNGDMELPLYRERLAGFQAALSAARLPFDENLAAYNIFEWEDAYDAMLNMLRRGHLPDAVFATSDPKALGVMRAVHDFGLRVPEDISVIGFDDSVFAPWTEPPLTTIAQPFYAMGMAAGSRLIKLIEGKSKPREKVQTFPAELVVRHSVR